MDRYCITASYLATYPSFGIPCMQLRYLYYSEPSHFTTSAEWCVASSYFLLTCKKQSLTGTFFMAHKALPVLLLEKVLKNCMIAT